MSYFESIASLYFKKFAEGRVVFKWFFLIITAPLYLISVMGLITLLFFDGFDESNTDAPLGVWLYFFSFFILIVFICLSWVYEKIFRIRQKGYLFILVLLFNLLTAVFTLFHMFSSIYVLDFPIYHIFRILLLIGISLSLVVNPEQLDLYFHSKKHVLKPNRVKVIAALVALSNATLSIMGFLMK